MRFTAIVMLTTVLCFLVSCADGHCHRKVDTQTNVKAAIEPSIPVQSPTRTPTVLVYKYDGSLQCQSGKGVSLERMAEELKGIAIVSQKKKRDGLMHIQVCGSATGFANVYEIPESSAAKAEKLGYKKWTFE